MNKIVWKNELSLGIKSIDDDHKKLISIINDLFDAIDGVPDKALLSKYFDELEAYTKYHFKREEAYIRQRCVSTEDDTYFKNHIKKHQAFVENIPKLKTKLLNASSKELAYETLEFLTNWLLDHIVSEDLSVLQCIPEEQEPQTKESKTLFTRLSNFMNKKFSLGTRTLLLVAVPMFFVIIFATLISINTYRNYLKLQDVSDISTISICINRLINDLQAERGLSNGYISSDYTNFATELKTKRIETDQTIKYCQPHHQKVKAYFDVTFLEKKLQLLPYIRKEIDEKKLTAKQNKIYYTSFIEGLIHLIKESGYLHITEKEEDQHSPLLLLLYIKENYGQLRSEGVTILEKKPRDLDHFRQLTIENIAYLKSFSILSSDELRKELLKIENSDVSQGLANLQTLILGHKFNIPNGANLWFENMSIKIDAYAKFISSILERIKHSALEKKQNALWTIILIWGTLFVIILFLAVILYALKISILSPIEKVTLAMTKLAKGDKSHYFTSKHTNDIIDQMAQAYNELRKSLIKADYAHILFEIQSRKTEKFEKLATIDPLTGILNKRYFMYEIETKVKDAQRFNYPLSLLILDLDHFKEINDTYGHDTGDDILKCFTTKVKQILAESEIFARIGGEEFAIILPETLFEDAWQRAEEILTLVREISFEEINPNIKLTTSIGVAQLQEDMTAKTLIKQADKNLYKAKWRGRDQVCCKEMP